MAFPDTKPASHDRSGTVRRIPQIEALGKAERIERGEQRVADRGKGMDMLMPVEEIGLAPHPLREGVDLAAELVGDFSERQTAKEGSSQHAADGRQLAARREARHHAKRVAAGEIEMHAEIGHAGELPQAREPHRPNLPDWSSRSWR